MTTDEYWAQRPNNIGSKRPKPAFNMSGDAEMSFGPDGIVVKNRAYRRQRNVHKLFRRTGFIAHLNKIRVIRRKNGINTTKYVDTK